MRERLQAWSEDETVGRALVIAGAILFTIQVVPWRVVLWALRFWPAALIIGGLWLILRKRED